MAVGDMRVLLLQQQYYYWNNNHHNNNNQLRLCLKYFTNENSFHLFNHPLRKVDVIIITVPILEKKEPKQRN